MRHRVMRVKFLAALIAAFVVIALSIAATPVNAAINSQVNFQGKLTNPDGTNIANGSYSIRFRIYTNATADAANTCSANSCVWEETKSITVADGIFQTALGSSTALTGVDFNNAGLYLGIKVGSDAEMTPRIQFTAAPYAFNADKLNGLSSSAFAQLSTANTFSGTMIVQGNNASQFAIQNSTNETLFIANTSTKQVAVGPAAVAANGVLTVGVNTTVASGGIYFGTDTNLYRSDVGTLQTSGNFSIQTTSTSAFEIKKANGTSLFRVDSSNDVVIFNGSGGLEFGDNYISNIGNDLVMQSPNGNVQLLAFNGRVTLRTGADAAAFSVNNGGAKFNVDTLNNRTNVGGAGGTSTLNVIGSTFMSGAVTVQGADAALFRIQNGSSQSLFVADTSAQQLAVGPAAVAANAVLTVGTNTTAATGGLYFGTDTNLYRSASGELSTGGALKITGATTIGSGTGVGTLQSWNGNNAFWINMPTTGPSGIGSGGPGANAWIAYAQGAGNYFTDAAAGDIAYRNQGGRLLFGVTAGLSNMMISGSNIQIGQAATDATAVLLTLDSYNNATDPAGTNGATYYNTSLGKFRCFEGGVWKNCITRELGTRSFVDTTADAIVDNNVTSYWDLAAENNSSFPNITPSSTTKSIWALVTVETSSTSINDLEFTAHVERTIGGAAPAACGSGTQVGAQPGTFATNTGGRKASTVQFIDSPATTNKVWFNVCSDSDTVNTAGNVTRIRVTLFEVDNANN